MSVIVPPDFAQGSVLWRLDGDPETMVTTIGLYHDSDPWDETNAEDLYDAFTTSLSEGLFATGYTIIGAVVAITVDVDDPPTVFSFYSDSPWEADGGDGLPQNNAYLIHKNTTVGGRAGKGRMYFPGVCEDRCDTKGVLADATRTELTTEMAAVAAHANSHDLFFCLFHSETSPIGEPTPLSSFVCDPMISTQRTRLRK